jgi:hypothetical protein
VDCALREERVWGWGEGRVERNLGRTLAGNGGLRLCEWWGEDGGLNLHVIWWFFAPNFEKFQDGRWKGKGDKHELYSDSYKGNGS